MTLGNLCVGIGIGLSIVIIIVSVISLLFYFISFKKIERTKNIYLSKLANTDSSISNAVKYLKLTNGIKDDRIINYKGINQWI